jgi:protein-L-isoaspartate(D-aspartate) O-methyltransferase
MTHFSSPTPGPCSLAAVLLSALALLVGADCRLSAQTRDEYDRARQRMVSEFLEKQGITNPRVLQAMRRVPRHEFVPAYQRRRAYEDTSLLIGYKQTITWPFIVAFMTEALDPRPTDRVLEVGTGTGYQAAVLSLLVDEVDSIEIIPALGKAAEKRLKRLGYKNVRTKIGDGYLGWPERAPFDKIILTCSPEKIPQPLIDQLKEGGRMVLPLGSRYEQALILLEKRKGRLDRREMLPTFFVPMTGRSDKERATKPDLLHPQIHNGGFEERAANGTLTGWYYQLQAKLSDRDAPEGRFCVQFDNEEPGQRSQALQALAVDGSKIASLRFRLKFRAAKIVDGAQPFEKAGLQVSFHNFRRLMGDVIAVHCVGSSDWQTASGTVPVPEEARESVIRIGLNGATGRLWLDDITLTPERRDR